MLNYLVNSRTGEETSLSNAILTSQPIKGGLYTPKYGSLPSISESQLYAMSSQSYQEVAELVLSQFDLGLTTQERQRVISEAYGAQWRDKRITPVRTLAEGLHTLDLWQGPTFAFKNVALELVPRVIALLNKKMGGKLMTILGASSGDTINAAHHGVKGLDDSFKSIFFLGGKPSDIQTLQAKFHGIPNAHSILAPNSDFDSLQSFVKLMNSESEAAFKSEHNLVTFNSIQILRVLAQIVYYFRAYSTLVQHEEVSPGKEIDVSIPSGNFGNALAALYARDMGVPIRKINIATNRNDILARFLATGIYAPIKEAGGQRAKALITEAPSQDITIASNFERALLWATRGNHEKVAMWMKQLGSDRESGEFTVDEETLKRFQEVFTTTTTTDQEIHSIQQETYRRYKHLIDPHTATAMKFALEVERSSDGTPVLVLETAHPAQFPASIHMAGVIPDHRDYSKIQAEIMTRPSGYSETPHDIRTPVWEKAIRKHLIEILRK